MNDDQFNRIFRDIQASTVSLTQEPLPKTLSFVHPTSIRMDDPRTAAYIHLKNLIRTYGIDIVLEAMDHAVGE